VRGLNSTKNLLLWTLFFGLLGSLVSSFIAPSVIQALFTPPVQFGTNCEPAGNWAMMSLRKTQLICFLLGSIFGAVVFVFLKKRERDALKKAALPTPGH
jgi:hypothetical protein